MSGERQHREALLLAAQATAGIACLELAAGRVFYHSSPAGGPPPENQDSLLLASLEDGTALLAVADGAGGLRGGDQASQLALKCLHQAVKGITPGDSVREKVLLGFDDAHRRIQALGIGAATTLAGVQIKGRRLRSFHAGDSQVLVMGQRGRRRLETMPHSPVGYALEAGLLDERAAIRHERRHVVTNLLGQGEPRIEYSAPLQLGRHDTVLVATDGLFQNLMPDEVIALLRKGDLSRQLAELVLKARGRMESPRGGQPGRADDLTVVAFRL